MDCYNTKCNKTLDKIGIYIPKIWLDGALSIVEVSFCNWVCAAEYFVYKAKQSVQT